MLELRKITKCAKRFRIPLGSPAAQANSVDAAIIEGRERVLLAAEMNGHADLPIKEHDVNTFVAMARSLRRAKSKLNESRRQCSTDILGAPVIADCSLYRGSVTR